MRYFIQDFEFDFENISLNDAGTVKGQAMSEAIPCYIGASIQN
jgi:hypothetical protein